MRHLILLVALISGTANAESYQLHLVSKHADGCDTCNEENFGIGYRGDGDIAPIFGYYNNSWFRDSFYGGVSLRFNRYVYFGAALVSGYVGTGDTAKNIRVVGELIPLPLFQFNLLPRKDVSPVISFVPTQDGGVALLSINFRR